MLAVATMFAVGTSVPSASIAQPIVADGTTATSVERNESGQITIGIAPTDANSISINSYERFNVPSTGIEIDNSTAQAVTIVNEVTSTNATTIEGTVSVAGPQADIVIANPNGVTVNGGTFRNAGHVGLTTGTARSDPNGHLIADVVSGEIVIGPNGLAGAMEELALLSKTLRVAGSSSANPDLTPALANIIAGSNAVSLNRDHEGFGQDETGQLPWALIVERGDAPVDGVTVAIERDSRFAAGRILLRVSDKGAGVRIAGDALASNGGFRLENSGRLEIDQSAITAKGSINIDTGSLTLSSGEETRATIESEESGVTVEARAGNIEIGQGRLAGRVVSSDNLSSPGGVTLTATGMITAQFEGEMRAQLVSDAGEQQNLPENSGVALTSSQGIFLDGIDVSATNDLWIQSSGKIAIRAADGNLGGDFRAYSDAELEFDASTITAALGVRIEGSTLRFGADDPEQSRTEIKAEGTGFVARSTVGDILNFGSLLQGNFATSSDSDSRGGMTVYAAGDFLNRSLSVDRLAVAFGDSEDLHLEVGGNVRNISGRLLSNAGVTVETGGDIVNMTLFTPQANPLHTERVLGRRFASSLFLRRQRDTLIHGDFGQLAIEGEQSFILGTGPVNLNGRNVINTGADITGSDINIFATGKFETAARQVGRVDARQSCRWQCKVSGETSTGLVGGSVSASGKLEITAAESATAIAASIQGITGVEFSAPEIDTRSLVLPTLIEWPSGMTGLFAGHGGYLEPQLQHTVLRSILGGVEISGAVKADSRMIQAIGPVVVSGTWITTSPPEFPGTFKRKPIGLLWAIAD